MVYIEEIIFLDLIIHISFLSITCYVCYAKINKKLLIISCILNIIIIFSYMFFIKNVWLNLIMSFIISIITFFNINITKLIKEVLIYFGLNISFGGLSNIIYLSSKINRYNVLGLLILFVIFTICFLYFYKNTINKNELIYTLIIIYKNQKIKINAYLDTANFLQSDNFIPIILISDKYHLGKLIKQETIYTISGSKVIDIYSVDQIYIVNKGIKKIDAYIAYSKMPFEGMFGLKILEG